MTQHDSTPKAYSCKVCGTELASSADIESRHFNGSQGPAFLFAAVRNVREDEAQERLMTTGTHIVRDVSCAICGQTLGWKYQKASEESQKYKEGKYLVEKSLLKSSSHENQH